MEQISVEKIEHRGETRIQINAAFEKETIAKIRKIQGRKWSQTRNAWHIPYTKESFYELKQAFGNIQIIEPGTKQYKIQTVRGSKQIIEDLCILKKIDEGLLACYIPEYRTAWKKVIKTIPGYYWEGKHLYWELPYVHETLTILKTWIPEHFIKIEFPIEENIPANYEPDERMQRKNEKWKKPNKSFQPIEELVRIKKGVAQYIGHQCIIKKINRYSLACYLPGYEPKWRQIIKQVPGWRWIPESAYWALPYVEETLEILRKGIPSGYLVIDFAIESDLPKFYERTKQRAMPFKNKRKKHVKNEDLNAEQQSAITSLKEALMLKRYSPATVKNYAAHFKYLLVFHKNKKPQDITIPELQTYLFHELQTKEVSVSMQNITISAVKYYWEQVLKRPQEYIEVPRPKKPKKLPNVLSKEEVIRLIGAIDNLKHKLILLFLYSSGLRRSEVINLRIGDINIERNSLFIKSGKGNKDRYVVLAQTVVPYILAYKKQYEPDHWLFEGIHGAKYSATSVQKIFARAKIKASINPYATLHTLRHSYATHCVEAGYSLKMVQESLGHSSLKTTEIYLHIAADVLKQMQSPLDSLDFT